MKLRVCAEFVDKLTGETCPVGAEITVSDERGAEILAHPDGLVEAIEGPASQKSASRGRKRGGVK